MIFDKLSSWLRTQSRAFILSLPFDNEQRPAKFN
jgi:hypothetical protein